MSDSPIAVELLLEGGQSQALKMTADAPELTRMFQILGARGTAVAEEQFFQLPLEGGEEAFSFNSAQLIAIRTRPPVLVDFQPLTSAGSACEAIEETVAAPDASYQRTQYQVVDNFLGHYSTNTGEFWLSSCCHDSAEDISLSENTYKFITCM